MAALARLPEGRLLADDRLMAIASSMYRGGQVGDINWSVCEKRWSN